VNQGFFSVLLVLSLAGCTAGTMIRLESEGNRVVVGSDLPWQEAYRRLNTQMQACLSAHTPVSAVKIDGQLYDELRMGEVAVTYPVAPFSDRHGPWARVQVRPATTGAEVTILTVGNAVGRSIAERVPRWLDGEQECRP
jgi:hypothetical protein